MNSAVHAERILQAWECLDFTGLKSAVDLAQLSCHPGAHSSQIEVERCEVLASAVTGLKALLIPSTVPSAHRLEASFNLLRHLRRISGHYSQVPLQ